MRYSVLKMTVPIALSVVLLGCHHGGAQSGYFASGTRNVDIAGLRSGGAEDPEAASGGPRLHPISAEDSVNIARVTAQLLEHRHFLRQVDHKTISERMFTLYIKGLDPLHYYLLDSDILEFSKGKDGLYDKVLDSGDTAPAGLLYTRYLQRFDESVTRALDELKQNNFKFDENDTLELDRKNAAPPKTIEEARELWHKRLKYEYLQEKLSKAKPEDIIKTLTKRYNRMSRTVHERDTDDILEQYLNAVAHAFDPHSDYFGKAMTDRFNDEMQLSLVGIGASLQNDDDGYCKIMSLLPGGPAIRSKKLSVGDRIVAVAQDTGDPVDVVEMKTDKIVGMIRGKKGTIVRLTIIPAGADVATRKIVTLVRDEVKLEEKEATGEIIDTPGSDGKPVRLGYINLPSFYADFSDQSSERKSTTADVAKLVRKLETEKMRGLVIDLRNNGGGSLEEVIHMTGLFVRKPTVVQVKKPNGAVSPLRAPDSPVLYDGPMIVITNRYSASASEIFAGAMQDYGRAVIVGDSATFGKGTVQTIEPLGQIMEQLQAKTDSNPGELKYTIEKFFRPSGSSTQLNGVASDIIIPSTTSVAEEYSEKMLEYAMPWDTVPGATFDRLGTVQPLLADLKRRSTARIAKDPDFAVLQKVIDEERRVLGQKTIQLNEQVRLKEKKDQDARLAEVKKALANRPPGKDKVYKFTLKQAALPGLPAPLDPKSEPKKKATDAADEPVDPVASSASAVDTTLEETLRILEDLIAQTPHATASR